jgi:hypothetical protein
VTAPPPLYDRTGRQVYQPVVRVAPGVLVSVFSEDMLQITPWAPLDSHLRAAWPVGIVEQPRVAAWAVLLSGSDLRALYLDMHPLVHPDNTLDLDLSRVDRVHGIDF